MYLPDEIWSNIYEYDCTYKCYFDKVINEIKQKNFYFRIRQK